MITMLGERRLEVLHRLISAGHFLLFGVAWRAAQAMSSSWDVAMGR
ncbi:MAG: hypothetical protein ACREWE_06350 [Gammaproteobacteria bacterium]